VTFIMSALCPLFIKKSYAFADWIAKKAPRFMLYGAGVVSRTLNKLVMPGSRVFTLSRPLLLGFLAYIFLVLAVVVTKGPLMLALYLLATGSCTLVWYLLQKDLLGVVDKVDYRNLGTLPEKQKAISRYVAAVACLGMLMVVNVALMYAIFWPSVAIITLAYLLWLIHLMKLSYDRTCDSSAYALIRQRGSQAVVPLELEKPQFNHRQRWKGL
jgi:uncharacterized membrane protein YbaN (DUF454 family)